MARSNQTKQALAAAMKDLMTRLPFSKINVGDICDACGLNRKSFYYHFQDKYDLVNWIFETEFISVMQSSPDRDKWDTFRRLCSYFYENRAFYRTALDIRGQNSLVEYFREVMEPLLRADLTDLLEERQDVVEFAARFYVDAFLCALIRWLKSRDPIPPDEFAK